jgi:hypothetical protein
MAEENGSIINQSIIEQKESIKLMKMSKGYNWEIKLLPVNVSIGKTDVDRLEELNNEIKKRFME